MKSLIKTVLMALRPDLPDPGFAQVPSRPLDACDPKGHDAGFIEARGRHAAFPSDPRPPSRFMIELSQKWPLGTKNASAALHSGRACYEKAALAIKNFRVSQRQT